MEGATSTGAVHKSVTFSCVQLNKCVVVCGSDLQTGHSGDIGVCLRRFYLNMSVVRNIYLFSVGPGYDGLFLGVLFRSAVR